MTKESKIYQSLYQPTQKEIDESHETEVVFKNWDIPPLSVEDRRRIKAGERPEDIPSIPLHSELLPQADDNGSITESKTDVALLSYVIPKALEGFEQLKSSLLPGGDHELQKKLAKLEELNAPQPSAELDQQIQETKKDIEILISTLDQQIAGCKKTEKTLADPSAWKERGEQLYEQICRTKELKNSPDFALHEKDIINSLEKESELGIRWAPMQIYLSKYHPDALVSEEQQ